MLMPWKHQYLSNDENSKPLCESHFKQQPLLEYDKLVEDIYNKANNWDGVTMDKL